MNLFDVKDRVIVITGATGVLGRAMVRHFAEEGAKVVILGRNKQVGNQLADEAVKAGGTAVFYTTDVLDKARLEQNYADIMERFGRIDVLINGAGGNMPGATIAPDKTLFDLDLEAMRQVVDLNLFGTVLPTMIFARAMVAQKQGSIINIASEAGLRPLTRVAGYGVAKAAVINFTKYMCGECHCSGILPDRTEPDLIDESGRKLDTTGRNHPGSYTFQAFRRAGRIVGHAAMAGQ